MQVELTAPINSNREYTLMKLVSAEVEGYRSIRQKMTLFVESSVTVILGPNDHGKTNLMNALLHLNTDCPFDEEDLNWDCSDNSKKLPEVQALFSLSENERNWLLDAENAERESINARIAEREAADGDEHDEEEIEDEDHIIEQQSSEKEPSTHQVDGTPIPPLAITEKQSESSHLEEVDEDDDLDEYADLPDEPLSLIKLKDLPEFIMLSRTGLESEVIESGLEHFQNEVRSGFKHFFPRLELIDPITKLSDSVSAEEIGKGSNEFMRGIFHYAGLDPNDSDELFSQSDRTQMAITRASETLNRTLKESWSQGKDLSFRLTHNSKDERIELQIEDPSVKSTYVRASRRSSGFTHYFSLKTILHSRQKDHPAESYILLFDEPGVFLHPSGQYDLLQVLETLALESQVIYVTHSLFMINKTFPTRHRLVMKNERGTTLDGKPYVGRWQATLTSLGLTLTGSILFANHVVLTEGDSDPIYIYAIIQKAVMAKKLDLDINSLAIMSTSESKNTDVLLRLLHESNPCPKIVLLCDGDKGGKERLEYVQQFIKHHDISNKLLSNGTSIEDHIPMIRDLYVTAVANYVGKLLVMQEKAKPDEKEFEEKFRADFDSRFEKTKVTHEVANWASEAAKNIGGLSNKPSKVGIAREYATLLLQVPNDEFKFDNTRSKTLIEWIQNAAGVPGQLPIDQKILED